MIVLWRCSFTRSRRFAAQAFAWLLMMSVTCQAHQSTSLGFVVDGYAPSPSGLYSKGMSGQMSGRPLSSSAVSVRRWQLSPLDETCRGGILPRTSSGHLRNLRLLASPSGIDEWSDVAQASVFFGTYVALALATLPSIAALDVVSKSIGLERWRTNVIDVTLPCVLGVLYVAAGAGHFVNAEEFKSIYPPRGTWGIWYLPGSADFHVAWTGLVEFLGGAGLLFSGIRSAVVSDDEDGDVSWVVNLLKPASALALFVLTVVVTPANIYMMTHGATMGDTGPLDMSFHYVRFGVQVALLSLLLTLAKDSFFFAWGDELD